MVELNPDANYGWGDPLDDDIRRLIEMVTELGIEVEDILLNALIAVLGMGTEGARWAQQAGKECEQRYQQAHEFGLSLIMGGRANADQARWIMELQQIGQSFRRIAQDSTWIAAQSLAMKMPAEDVLLMVGSGIDLLEYLAEGTRDQVRNTIIFTTSRNRDNVRQILQDSADVQRSYIMLEGRVTQAIAEHPRESFPMQQLLGIAARLANIDRRCTEVASAVLSDPPPMPPRLGKYN